jgi:hypothetical protein
MPRLRKKFADSDLVVCIESFASSDPVLQGCARGVKLRGSNPIVVRWPFYFVKADTADDEIFRARKELYAEAGAPPLS